jgi:deoxyadenosine/deoxycytidine kinase
MSLSRYRYVVVEGPIGAGKTSLARRLAERLEGETLLERPELNPFLAKFYQEPARYALQNQLFFLFQRIQQLRELSQLDLFGGITVADFLIDKDPLFAQLTLSGDELHLYQTIYENLRPQAARPDLVIYLQAQPDTLIQRIRKRGREYEQQMSEDYLAALADSYSRFFYHYGDAPVLIVNSEPLNFVDRDSDLELLLERMSAMRGGREFFNVGE